MCNLDIDLTYKSKQHIAYSGARGFVVDLRAIILMALWLQGKSDGNTKACQWQDEKRQVRRFTKSQETAST